MDEGVTLNFHTCSFNNIYQSDGYTITDITEILKQWTWASPSFQQCTIYVM